MTKNKGEVKMKINGIRYCDRCHGSFAGELNLPRMPRYNNHDRDGFCMDYIVDDKRGIHVEIYRDICSNCLIDMLNEIIATLITMEKTNKISYPSDPRREIERTAAIAMSKNIEREFDILLKSKSTPKPAPRARKKNRKKST